MNVLVQMFGLGVPFFVYICYDKSMRKMDYIFAIVVLLSSIIIWYISFRTSIEGNYAEVMLDQECIARYDLTQDGEYVIQTSAEDYNRIRIQDGHVSVVEADCPDGLCIKQHAISRNGESIICLPHKLVIKVVSEDTDSNTLDAITN